MLVSQTHSLKGTHVSRLQTKASDTHTHSDLIISIKSWKRKYTSAGNPGTRGHNKKGVQDVHFPSAVFGFARFNSVFLLL